MARNAGRTNSTSPKILLEVRPASMSGDLGPGLAMPEQFQQRASEIAGSVAEVASQFRLRLEKELKPSSVPGWHMDSIELRFDIAVQAEAGVIIARASSGATFSAKLTMKALTEKQ
jgi:Trypsin-co-occurring domain 1